MRPLEPTETPIESLGLVAHDLENFNELSVAVAENRLQRGQRKK